MNDHIKSVGNEEAQPEQKEPNKVLKAKAQPANEPSKRAALSKSLKPDQQIFGSIKPQLASKAQVAPKV